MSVSNGWAAIPLLGFCMILVFHKHLSPHIEHFIANAVTTFYAYNALNYTHVLPEHTVKHVNVADQEVVFEALKARSALPPQYQVTRKGGASVFSVDPLDFHQYLQPAGFSEYEDAALPKQKGMFVGMGTMSKVYGMKCAQDFYGKTIGYFERTDLKLLRSIVYGYRIPLQNVTFKQIPLEMWFDLERVLEGVDLAVAFVVENSPFQKMLARQSISIFGFKWLDIARVQLTYPFTELEEVTLKNYFIGNAKVMHQESETKVLIVRQMYVAVDASNVESFKTETFKTETFVTKLGIPTEKYNDNYKCYGDDQINIFALCQSPFDQIGMVKRTATTWDKPCETNEECPFYDSNTGLGACTKGKCDLPVGAQAKGYRQYNIKKPFTPFCHNCGDVWDIDCCAKQSEPQYAFPDDFKKRGLWISLD